MPEIVEEYPTATLLRQKTERGWNKVTLRHTGRTADGTIYRYTRNRFENLETGQIVEAGYSFDFSIVNALS